MKILLVTIAWPDAGEYNIYSDLMHEFVENGNQVVVAAVNERSKKANKQKTYLACEGDLQILHVMSGSIQKSNKYSKVIHSFLSGPKILKALHLFLPKQSFDFILFTTPPITLTPGVVILKWFYHTRLYLLLKDIWPQDAVDLGAMRKGGIVWTVFRFLEKMTYKNSDYIGCMSPANIQFVRKNNTYLKDKIIEECPNSEKLRPIKIIDRVCIREKYELPNDKLIFIYGGNLGKAQGVDFLIDIIEYYQGRSDLYFLIIGAGTEFNNLYNKITNHEYQNAKILPWVTKSEFTDIVQSCDVGLILLNKNSSVPNFPSRLLTYLTAKIPVIAAVDEATDIGDIIEASGCGLKALNGDMNSFHKAVEILATSEENRKQMGEKGYQLFLNQYTTKRSYEIIVRHFQKEKEM